MPDFLQLDFHRLKYLDALIYLTIRSHCNNKTQYGYPSYEYIAAESGLSRSFAVSSVKRLERAGFLRISHSKRQGRCNRYHFGRLEHFERIPPELLQVSELIPYEKAMLICLRQFFNHGLFTSGFRTTDFAKWLGIGYRAVDRQLKSLIAKGYIIDRIGKATATYKHKNYYMLTDKIDWRYEYNVATKELSPRLLMVG